MRNLFFILACALYYNSVAFAGELIPLTFTKIEETSGGNGHPKAPIPKIAPPNLYIEGHVLSFPDEHGEYTLNIKDEDGNVVYSTFVSSDTTLVTLPSTLSGDYEVELIIGYWKFTGWINL